MKKQRGIYSEQRKGPDNTDIMTGNSWDRQAWDTDVSYYNFQTYYLALPANERNLQQAYRNYRASKGLQRVSIKGRIFGNTFVVI